MSEKHHPMDQYVKREIMEWTAVLTGLLGQFMYRALHPDRINDDFLKETAEILDRLSKRVHRQVRAVDP